MIKKLLVISILGFIVLVTFLWNRVDNTDMVTLKSNLTVRFLEEKHVSDFIKNLKGDIIDDYAVDTTSLGKKNITFKYRNDLGKIVSYSFDIEVIDDEAPLAFVSNSYRVPKGGKLDFVKDVFCGDNADSTPNCFIEGDYNLDKEGTYPVTFKAIDDSGNIYEKDTKIIVYEPIENSREDGSNRNNGPQKVEHTYFKDVVSAYKNEHTKIGIDVSKWQGDIDFDALKNAGVEFIMIRVGTTDGIGGEHILDPKFIQNIENANRVGIDAGIYFYSYANTKQQAVSDAIWVLEQIKDYHITLPVAFDWEDWNDFNEYQISFYGLTEIANTFTEIMEMFSYDSMVYGSKYYLETIWRNPNAPIWLAHYTSETNYQGNYKLWQHCNNGKVDGIAGQVDIDILYLENS